MKKTITYLSAIAVLLLSSCGGMDEVYKEYKGDSPVIRTEKIEEIAAYSGKYRVKLMWDEMNDSRIKGATVYWNNRKSHQDFTIDPHKKTEIIVDSIPEGTALLEVVTWDSYGHTSVATSLSVSSYGSEFISFITDRSRILSAARNSSGDVYVQLSHSTSSYYKYMEVEYENLQGEKVIKKVEKDTSSILIENCADKPLICRSAFLPEEDCIDMLYSDDVKTGELSSPSITMGSESVRISFANGGSSSVACESNWVTTSVEVSGEAKSWLSVGFEDNTLTCTALSRNSGTSPRTGKVSLTSDAFTKEITVTQQGQCDKYGTAYGTEGIIFWQNPDNPKEYKIISATGWAQTKWSTSASTTGATSYTGFTGGKKNIDRIRSMSDYGNGNTYAMQSIEGLGEGWYMPSLNEMKDEFWPTFNGAVLEASTKGSYNQATEDEKACRDKFENAMKSISGSQKINMMSASSVGSCIMTCTEADADNQVAFRVGNPEVIITSKTTKNNCYARGIKVVTIE